MNEVSSTIANAVSAARGSSSTQSSQGKSATVEQSTVSKLPAQESEIEMTEKVEQAEVSKAKVDEAVSKLNDYVQSTQRDLFFSFNDSVNKTVVTVVDRNTDKVVRQIPNEVAISIAASLNEEEPLRLFSAQA